MRTALAIFALTLAASAQQMSDAEKRHIVKYGRPYPQTELRRQAEQKEMERRRSELFEAFDRNRDGVISRDEWTEVYSKQLKVKSDPCEGSNSRT